MSDVTKYLCGKNYRKKLDNDIRKNAADSMVKSIQNAVVEDNEGGGRNGWKLDVDAYSDGEEDNITMPKKAASLPQRHRDMIDRAAVSFNALGKLLQNSQFNQAKAYWDTSAAKAASELQKWTTILSDEGHI